MNDNNDCYRKDDNDNDVHSNDDNAKEDDNVFNYDKILVCSCNRFTYILYLM